MISGWWDQAPISGSLLGGESAQDSLPIPFSSTAPPPTFSLSQKIFNIYMLYMYVYKETFCLLAITPPVVPSPTLCLYSSADSDISHKGNHCKHVAFWDWLKLSLTILYSRFMNVADSNTTFLFMAEEYSFGQTTFCLSIHQLLGIWAVPTFCGHKHLCVCVLVPLGIF